MEVVAETALRAAVNQEGHRVFLALLIVRRLDHVAVDGFVVPAVEIETARIRPWRAWRNDLGIVDR